MSMASFSTVSSAFHCLLTSLADFLAFVFLYFTLSVCSVTWSFVVFVAQGTEPETSSMLGQCSTTTLYLWPCWVIFHALSQCWF